MRLRGRIPDVMNLKRLAWILATLLAGVAASNGALAALSSPRICQPAAAGSTDSQDGRGLPGGIVGTGRGAEAPSSGIVGTGRSPEISSSAGIVGTGHRDTRTGGSATGDLAAAGGTDSTGGTGGSGSNGGSGGIGGTGHQVPKTGEPGSGGVATHGIGGTGAHAGRLALNSGQISVRDHTGRALVLKGDDAVCAGDQLATGREGDAEIRLADGAVLSIAPGSVVNVADYAFDANRPEAGISVIALQVGQFRIVSGLIAKRNREKFLIKSKDVDIRVMGTDFQVAYLPTAANQYAAGTYVTVDTGQVRLDTDRGVLMLVDGESGYFGGNAPPRRIKSAPGFMSCR